MGMKISDGCAIHAVEEPQTTGTKKVRFAEPPVDRLEVVKPLSASGDGNLHRPSPPAPGGASVGSDDVSELEKAWMTSPPRVLTKMLINEFRKTEDDDARMRRLDQRLRSLHPLLRFVVTHLALAALFPLQRLEWARKAAGVVQRVRVEASNLVMSKVIPALGAGARPRSTFSVSQESSEEQSETGQSHPTVSAGHEEVWLDSSAIKNALSQYHGDVNTPKREEVKALVAEKIGNLIPGAGKRNTTRS